MGVLEGKTTTKSKSGGHRTYVSNVSGDSLYSEILWPRKRRLPLRQNHLGNAGSTILPKPLHPRSGEGACVCLVFLH